MMISKGFFRQRDNEGCGFELENRNIAPHLMPKCLAIDCQCFKKEKSWLVVRFRTLGCAGADGCTMDVYVFAKEI
ncbi:MAG: hypothetical protein EPGJADBJ_04693 [Saprospiraceae bacterium]|nr:hypothetical protein [Saprospiraceae bacterium]